MTFLRVIAKRGQKFVSRSGQSKVVCVKIPATRARSLKSFSKHKIIMSPGDLKTRSECTKIKSTALGVKEPSLLSVSHSAC